MIYTVMALPSGVTIALLIAALLLFLGAVFSFFFLLYVAKRVYDGTLVREEGKWGYECSCPDDPEQMKMWNEGVLWYEENRGVMREVDITSVDGLHLHGEYYDFGGECAVIILPGRCECLRYSCYFAKPYGEMGINVLCIDTRSHGKSDGKFSTIGKMEGEDVRSWVSFLEREMGVSKVWLHAICLGGAAAFYSAVGKDAPAAIKGIVAEGPYVTFRETYKQHLIQMKKPHIVLVDLIMARIKKETGVDYCGERVFIRMFRSRDGGCELFISRTEEKGEKGERVEEGGSEVVCFPTANALISACRAMVGGESDAYIGDKLAYLIIPKGSEAELAVAEEFGKTVDFFGAEEFVREHCDLLVKGNAASVIGKL